MDCKINSNRENTPKEYLPFLERTVIDLNTELPNGYLKITNKSEKIKFLENRLYNNIKTI